MDKVKKEGFVLYEYTIKQRSFCKYTNICDMKKPKENNMSTVNRKYFVLMGNT